MRSFLHPSTLSFTEEEWDNFDFVNRLDDLATALVSLENTEANAKVDGKPFRFRASERVMDSIYDLNPTINRPPRPVFYKHQFHSTILPKVLSRMDYCPAGVCVAGTAGPARSPTPQVGAPKVIQDFLDDLSLCGSCGDKSISCLVTHADAPHTPMCGFFDIQHYLPDDLIVIGDAVALFPWEDKPHQDKALMLSLQVKFAQSRALDSTWGGFNLSNVRAGEGFWRTLRAADFRGKDYIYRQRILDCLLQIATARDVDIFEHGMAPQTVRVEGRDHGKWNAYVFRNGPSPIDRRCSRIYFAKTADGIFVDEFCPDAH